MTSSSDFLGESISESDEADVDGAIGFNLGGGVKFDFGLVVEVGYHMVSRKMEGSESAGMNTWNLLFGYQLDF